MQVDKLDIDKTAKLVSDKSKPVPTELSKLSVLVKTDVVKKKDYNAEIFANAKILQIKCLVLLA